MPTLGKQEKIAIPAAIVGAAILFFGGQLWSMVVGQAQPAQQSAFSSTGTSTAQQQITMQNISTTQGIEIYDEKVGTGAEAVAGKTVTAHYVGYLTNGTKFDSSLDRNEPFPFVLGKGSVIKGWDVGIVGMKVGGVRRLVISPELAYGTRAIGPIPANSTLVFQVNLIDVK